MPHGRGRVADLYDLELRGALQLWWAGVSLEIIKKYYR